MIIYAIEICINSTETKNWLTWMLGKHIPDMMNTNLFNNYKIFQNLNTDHTYTIQYELDDLETYIKYQEIFADDLQKEHAIKFKNKYQATRKLFMEINNNN